jgi:hypothetical protein
VINILGIAAQGLLKRGKAKEKRGWEWEVMHPDQWFGMKARFGFLS